MPPARRNFEVERRYAFGQTYLDVFNAQGDRVGRAIYTRDGDEAEVTYLQVDGQHRGLGYGQALIDAIREDLGDIGDPDLDFELAPNGTFRTGNVRARYNFGDPEFLRQAMAETKRRRDQGGTNRP